MSDSTELTDAEALAQIIRPYTLCDDAARFDHGSLGAAQAVLASNWLAARTATADERLAAVEAVADSDVALGGYMHYAVPIGNDVILAVGLDDLRASLGDSTALAEHDCEDDDYLTQVSQENNLRAIEWRNSARTLADRDPRVRAQALDETAEAWKREGRAVAFNKRKQDLLYDERVLNWLRARADRERGAGA